MNTGAQLILLAANLLLLVNFCRTACVCQSAVEPLPTLFRPPAAKMEAHAS
jgi:hypothetical protein